MTLSTLPPARLSPPGHSHRVSLMLSLLQLPHEFIQVDLQHGAHKSPEFLAMNPFGLVPVLQDGEITLAESNAILGTSPCAMANPLAAPAIRLVPRGWSTGCPWRPAAGSRTGPCAHRRGVREDPSHPELLARSHALLAIIDASLARSAYLVGEIPSIC